MSSIPLYVVPGMYGLGLFCILLGYVLALRLLTVRTHDPGDRTPERVQFWLSGLGLVLVILSLTTAVADLWYRG